MNRGLLIGAAITTLALPAAAHAHEATVTCNPTGGYDVTTDRPNLTPSWVFTPTAVTVTWTDGFVRTVALPAPCVASPAPTPTPAPAPTPAVEPQPQPTPTLAPPPPATRTPTRARPKPRPRIITCAFVTRHYRGAARTRMVTRHGLPKTCGRRYNPPVTG